MTSNAVFYTTGRSNLHDDDLRRYAQGAVTGFPETQGEEVGGYAWHCLQLLDRLALPRYLLIIEEQERWVYMHQTGPIVDNGWVSVTITDKVMEPDGTVRKLTKPERDEMIERADEYSGSK